MPTSIRRLRRFPVAALAFCLFAGGAAFVAAPALPAQQAPAAPQKQTVRVAMADGVKLATDVYLPEGKGPFPVILLRTPYDKNGGAGIGADGARRGYALVIQDTRGRGASEGENLPFVGDLWGKHRDGYDTLEWIAKQPWCNGKIGSFGGSALGITQLGMAGAGTTRLACQHIAVAAPDMYRYGVYPGGVFKKAMIEDWLRDTKHSPESLTLWTSHPDYDAYWRDRDLTTRWNRVNAPAIHLGGWYDIFTQGTIDTFLGYQTRGGPNARGRQKLLLGPWTHGILQNRAGELTFPNGNAPPNAIADPWRWFDCYLKGEQNGMADAPAVTYYVMGDVSDPKAPGNVWRTAATWPPVKTKPTPFYLHADRTLSPATPAAGDASLTYAYDPKDPVPTVGGPQLTIPAGPMDQRRIESRPDVLVFTSEPLTAPLEVTGRVRVTLHASSDAPDTDLFAKLCDVYPDGRSINICEGQLRARFRESFQREKLLKPGQVATFDIDLSSTSIIFNRGHRLRVQITSSSAPGYDPNPNTGEPFRASDRTHIAHNTLYLDAERPSFLLLPIAIRSSQFPQDEK